MTQNRFYSSTAGVMALQADINSSVTSFGVDVVSGLPQAPFTVALDYGTASEELVTCTGVSALTLTVSRGQDGTTAQSHSAGAVVRHVWSARDMDEAAKHLAATSSVHGVTGPLVGASSVASLDSKTFVSGTGSTTPAVFKAASGQSVDVFQIQNSGATVVGGLDSALRATLLGLLVNKPVNNVPTIVAKAGSGQTAALFDAQDSSGVSLFKVAVDGTVTGTGALTAASVAAAKVNITSTSTSVPTNTVKAAAGQTAALTQWQNSSGTVLADVDKDGNGYFTNLPAQMTWGTIAASTDAAGLTSVPTGIGSGKLLAFVAWPGDVVANANVTLGRYGAYTVNGGVPIRAYQADDHVPYANHNLRIDWIAIGAP